MVFGLFRNHAEDRGDDALRGDPAQVLRTPEQLRDRAAGRESPDFRRGAGLDDSTVVEDRDAVGEVQRLLGVVGHQERDDARRPQRPTGVLAK